MCLSTNIWTKYLKRAKNCERAFHLVNTAAFHRSRFNRPRSFAIWLAKKQFLSSFRHTNPTCRFCTVYPKNPEPHDQFAEQLHSPISPIDWPVAEWNCTKQPLTPCINNGAGGGVRVFVRRFNVAPGVRVSILPDVAKHLRNPVRRLIAAVRRPVGSVSGVVRSRSGDGCRSAAAPGNGAVVISRCRASQTLYVPTTRSPNETYIQSSQRRGLLICFNYTCIR